MKWYLHLLNHTCGKTLKWIFTCRPNLQVREFSCEPHCFPCPQTLVRCQGQALTQNPWLPMESLGVSWVNNKWSSSNEQNSNATIIDNVVVIVHLFTEIICNLVYNPRISTLHPISESPGQQLAYFYTSGGTAMGLTVWVVQKQQQQFLTEVYLSDVKNTWNLLVYRYPK